MSWADALKRLTDKGSEDLGKLAAAVKIEVFSGIARDTRVDTGRLRGNWKIQENTPATGTRDITDETPAGAVPAYQRKEIVDGSTEDGLTYFVNNLPYAVVYEEHDAMVGRNVARIKQNIKSIADKLR